MESIRARAQFRDQLEAALIQPDIGCVLLRAGYASRHRRDCGFADTAPLRAAATAAMMRRYGSSGTGAASHRDLRGRRMGIASAIWRADIPGMQKPMARAFSRERGLQRIHAATLGARRW